MGFDDDLKRGLRKAAAELESGNEPLRPARAGAKRGVRMRPAAAGLGMAVSIAATVALFAQLLPSTEPGGSVRPAAASDTPSLPVSQPDATDRPADDPAEGTTERPKPAPSAAPDESAGPSGRATTEPLSKPNCGPPPEVYDAYSQFRVTLEASPVSASSGQAITFRVRLTNDGPDASYEEGNPRAEVFVYDRAGAVVWVSSSGKVYTQELRMGTYRQGETVEVSEAWEQQGCEGPDGTTPTVGPGGYTVRARWNGNRGGWSQPVSIEIR